MSNAPRPGMSKEQRKKLFVMVIISDVVVFGLAFYFLVIKPAQNAPKATPTPAGVTTPATTATPAPAASTP